MTKKKIITTVLIIITAGLLSAAGIALYMFNKPHRDVQSTRVDFTLKSSDLVSEYLANPKVANEKYLDESGNSKILAITGVVHSLSRDMNNQWVVRLIQDGDKVGVSCTFTAETNASAEKLAVGQAVTVKGVIRSGAGYDEDLDLYEDVIIEKCDVINN